MSKCKRNESLAYIKQYANKGHIAILSTLAILSSLMLVLVAFMTKMVIDAIIERNINDIIMSVSIALVLLLGYAVILGVNNYLTTRFCMIATRHIVADTHNHLLLSPYQAVASTHSVEQLKIVSNDAEIAVSSYISLFPTVASIIVKLIAGIILMLFVSYRITLIALAVGVLVCILMVLVRKPIKALHKSAQQAVALSNAYMQESLKNIEVVKALDISDFVKDGVETRLESVRLAFEKKTKFVNAFNSMVYFLLEATFLFVLVYGGSLIAVGELSLASFIVLVSVIEIIKQPFMSAAKISASIYNMLASAERVKTIISLPNDKYVDEKIDSIVMDDVTFGYEGSKVLSHIDLTINKGDKFALSGDSGAGKSTFIRLLLGLIKPNSGTISIVSDGVSTPLGDRLIRASYVPQDIELFNDTIINNLLSGKDIDGEICADTLRMVDIYDEVASRGVDTKLGEGGDGISQGQMQRIAIARALLRDSDIVILDEPFASLDEATAKDIFAKLMALDKTIIIASHDEFVRDGLPNIVLSEVAND